MLKRCWSVLAFMGLCAPSFGQMDISELLKLYTAQTKGDVQKLASAYIDPMGKNIGNAFNNGWYTTAKAHGLGGFNLTIAASITPISSGMKNFDVSKLGLEQIEVASGSSSITPTVFGKDNGAASVALANQTMNLPSGINLPVLPMPIYNVGVGLPLHTEVNARFVPSISFGDGKFGLWGIGIKNEFKEFIPAFKLLPFSMSAFFGYTNYNLSWDLAGNNYCTSNSMLKTSASSYTARLLVSKSIPILTFYGGLGYNSSSSNYDMKGDYKVPLVAATITDPVSLSYNQTGVVVNAGLRFKFAVFTLFGDYSFAEYSMYSAGFGISFR